MKTPKELIESSSSSDEIVTNLVGPKNENVYADLTKEQSKVFSNMVSQKTEFKKGKDYSIDSSGGVHLSNEMDKDETVNTFLSHVKNNV